MAALGKLKAILNPPGDTHSRTRLTLLRRQKLLDRLARFLPAFRSFLIVGGLLYLLALPARPLGRGHHVSENALQPAQVNTYWNWADVHVADLIADDVATWTAQNVSVESRAQAIKRSFEKLGLPAATQSYTFNPHKRDKTMSGTNTYAIYRAPKTDGVESLVLSVSWLSRDLDEQGNRRVNIRGVATVLALANYLKKSSYWSKDIIFLVSDGYLDGAQAWLDAFHGYQQANLQAEELVFSTGGIWGALNLDYPYHSFSHVGLFYEGTNGHLSNVDFVNSASTILKHTGVPVVLHADTNLAELRPTIFATLPTPLRAVLDNDVARTYQRAAVNLARQLAICASGRPVGPEGLFGRYRIDALTFFAIPAEGPHGFHALGRAVEATFRSLNNLLERFHQSFFLYIMTSVETFITVGNYLAAPILVGAGLTINGLELWASAGAKHVSRSQATGRAVVVIGATHAIGLVMFTAVTRLDTSSAYWLPVTLTLFLLFTPMALAALVRANSTPGPNSANRTSKVLKAFNLLLAGLTLSIVATLNFGAAVALSLILPLPMLVVRPLHDRPLLGQLQQFALVAVSPPATWALIRALGFRTATDHWAQHMLRDWSVAGGWSLPFVFVVVVPLFLQSATSALL